MTTARRRILSVTLGDFFNHNSFPSKKGNQRCSADPFARDPFKVQSYNFRYADKPHPLPLQNLANRVNQNTTPPKAFETYYYNPDFLVNRHAKENPPNISFHENRRRRFICEQSLPNSSANFYNGNRSQTDHTRQSTGLGNQYRVRAGNSAGTISSPEINVKATSSPYLKRGCTREFEQGYHESATVRPNSLLARQQQTCKGESQTSIISRRSTNQLRSLRVETGLNDVLPRRQATSSSTLIDNVCSTRPKVGRSCSQPNTSIKQKNFEVKTLVTPRVRPSSSSCSGCQININIKGLDDSQASENVTIKIDTASLLDKGVQYNAPKSAAVDTPERTTSPNCNNLNVGEKVSTQTFVINKCVSKFSVLGDQYKNEVHEPEQQRKPPVRATSVAYQLQSSAARKTAPSERTPSLVPWNSSTKLSTNCNTVHASCTSRPSSPRGPTRGKANNTTQWSKPSQSNQTANKSTASKPLNSRASAAAHLRRIYQESWTSPKNLRTSQNTVNKNRAGSSTAPSGPKIPEGTNSTQKPPLDGTRFWHARYSPRNPQVNTPNRPSSHTSLRETSSRTNSQTAGNLSWTTSRKRGQSPVNVNINVYADQLLRM